MRHQGRSDKSEESAPANERVGGSPSWEGPGINCAEAEYLVLHTYHPLPTLNQSLLLYLLGPARLSSCTSTLPVRVVPSPWGRLGRVLYRDVLEARVSGVGHILTHLSHISVLAYAIAKYIVHASLCTSTVYSSIRVLY